MENTPECKIIEVDLDRNKALEEFDLYKDHPLQPKGYNIFLHNPPHNPENRVLIKAPGQVEKLITYESNDIFEWKKEECGTVWDWADTDVWAWIKAEDGQMYHLTLTTTSYELSRLQKVYHYFTNLLSNNVNIYTDESTEQFLPEGFTFQQAYRTELGYIKKKIDELGLGHIKRDPADPDYMLLLCLPEENLSNSVLEKWLPTIQEFIQYNLPEVNFTQGEVR